MQAQQTHRDVHSPMAANSAQVSRKKQKTKLEKQILSFGSQQPY
jgi:hypothetical protein